MEPSHSDAHVDFDCVVVGGGQAGLGTGGRLKALGISYVILEKNVEVGDSWATRYDSTRCKSMLCKIPLKFDLLTAQRKVHTVRNFCEYQGCKQQ